MAVTAGAEAGDVAAAVVAAARPRLRGVRELDQIDERGGIPLVATVALLVDPVAPRLDDGDPLQSGHVERMDLATIGLMVFLAVSVISAVLWHAFVRTATLAVIGATVTTVVTFHLIGSVVSSKPEKFILVAIIVSSICALAISIGVGVVFWLVRRRRTPTGR